MLNELINDQNKDLFERVQAHYSIQFEQDKLQQSWYSNILEDKKIALVGYCPTEYPIPSFTHELLHFDLQMKGYKRVINGYSLDFETQFYLPKIVSALDNELQHHKMFPLFQQMGFSETQFYNDLDKDIETVTSQLSDQNLKFNHICMSYLGLLAPGGAVSKDKIGALKQTFYSYREGLFESQFFEIDKIFEDWVKDETNNNIPYVIRFFQNIGNNRSWISHVDFGNSLDQETLETKGFFIGTPFDMKELMIADQNHTLIRKQLGI